MPTVKDIVVKKPSAEEAIECQSWPIWEKEVSSFDWQYTQKEICLLIEGKVTVSDETGSVSFAAGDLVVLPKDLDCKWDITEQIRKHYTFE